MAGLHDLLHRLTRRREELLASYQLGDVLADVRGELDAIVGDERGVAESRRAAPRGPSPLAMRRACCRRGAARPWPRVARRRRCGRPGPAGDAPGRHSQAPRPAQRAATRRRRRNIRGLQEYDFLERARATASRRCSRSFAGQVLDSMFEGLSQAIRDATPEQLAANRDMVRDLNRLLSERLAGDEPAQDRVDRLPGAARLVLPGARSLDDIVEQLAQRMAAMQSLMASMSAQQRDELQSMMDALLRDDRLRWDLAQLASTLDQLLPDGLGSGCASGARSRSRWMARSSRWRASSAWTASRQQLSEVADPAPWPTLDARRCASWPARRPPRTSTRCRTWCASWRRQATSTGRGERLELTARGTRRLGQHVLDELFSKLRRDAFGGHPVRRAGLGGERTDESTAWEFGRPFQLDLQRTLANSLARPENAPAARASRAAAETSRARHGRGRARRVDAGAAGLRLSPADFAVSTARS